MRLAALPRLTRFLLGAALLLVPAGCSRSARPPAAAKTLVWHSIGSWSGRGNAQTGTFTSDSGTLRVRWEARNETAGRTGTLKLVVESAISGRSIAIAADQRGVGRGESVVAEDSTSPVYVLVESSDVDWSFSVEEGLVATKPASG